MHKSRNQSIYDFLECLQLEYITAEVRSKIYTSSSDKNYYKKVMYHKKIKIEDIASRNGLPTIFGDKDGDKRCKEDMYNKIYVKFGQPDFIYRDDDERFKIEEKDIVNYYAIGAEVKILNDDVTEIGIIVDNEQLIIAYSAGQDDLSKIPIAVKKRNQEKDSVALISHLSRIL